MSEGVDGDGDDDDDTIDAGPDAMELPSCTAQRAVHVVAGIGGLSWFTLVWPAPEVISNFEAGYAFDDPSRAVSLSGDQPLYVRRQTLSGETPLWAQTANTPQPSAFVVGSNETHTQSPVSATTLGTRSVVGQAATLQATRLNPPIPVLVFDNAPLSVPAGGPTPLRVDDVDSAISAVGAMAGLSSEQQAALIPDPATIASWLDSPAGITTTFAERLLFTANLLKQGLVGTVVIDALEDDPHAVFENLVAVTRRANNITNALEGFYRELEPVSEANCGHNGEPLSLADNVVMLVSGDTPKNSFNATPNWADGSPGGGNLLYVRSNGWLKSGWFGNIEPGARTNFNPQTGNLDGGASDMSNLAAALNATLYALTRGDTGYVQAFDPQGYDGVRATVAP